MGPQAVIAASERRRLETEDQPNIEAPGREPLLRGAERLVEREGLGRCGRSTRVLDGLLGGHGFSLVQGSFESCLAQRGAYPGTNRRATGAAERVKEAGARRSSRARPRRQRPRGRLPCLLSRCGQNLAWGRDLQGIPGVSLDALVALVPHHGPGQDGGYQHHRDEYGRDDGQGEYREDAHAKQRRPYHPGQERRAPPLAGFSEAVHATLAQAPPEPVGSDLPPDLLVVFADERYVEAIRHHLPCPLFRIRPVATVCLG